jgi:hypothetical protein
LLARRRLYETTPVLRTGVVSLAESKGNVVMGIVEADLPPVDVSQFQGFVVMALAKLRTQ